MDFSSRKINEISSRSRIKHGKWIGNIKLVKYVTYELSMIRGIVRQTLVKQVAVHELSMISELSNTKLAK